MSTKRRSQADGAAKPRATGPAGATPKRAAKVAATAPLVVDRGAYQLNLRGRGLTALPDAVAEMTRVAMVFLGDNALSELPAPILSVAAQLVSLELGPNPLEGLEGGAIARFERLTDLDLRQTRLTRLPEELTRLPLRTLVLHGNPQLDLDQALAVVARMPTLRWLWLSACGLAEVPRGVSALGQLERLDLGSNAISVLSDALAALELDVLGLKDNRIERIPDALEGRVRTVYFAGNPGARAEKRRFDAIRRHFVSLD